LPVVAMPDGSKSFPQRAHGNIRSRAGGLLFDIKGKSGV
jgi:hypothetical protein